MNSRALMLLLLMAAGLLVVACSDEPYGSLYCPPGPRDTLVVYPRLEFQQVRVELNPYSNSDDRGMAAMQSLYLGSSEETASDILVNFDFDKGRWLSPTYPDSLFHPNHIKKVSLWLNRLLPHHQDSDTTDHPTTGVMYEVRQLETPFAREGYLDWPGAEPSPEGPILNSDFTEISDLSQPRIHLYVEDFLTWSEASEEVGMVISAGDGSDPGLVGFASQELTRFQILDPLMVGESFSPTIVVEFEDATIPYLQIPPVNDTSTFHQVAALPPDQVQVQSGLHSYSVLAFDIPSLPAGSCVTGLGFRMSPVNVSPMWATGCLFMEDLDATRVDWSDGLIQEFPYGMYWGHFRLCLVSDQESNYLGWGPESGFVGPLPNVMHLINFFDQEPYRYGNGLAHIYFSQSTFHGPGAAPEIRPALMIITGKKDD